MRSAIAATVAVTLLASSALAGGDKKRTQAEAENAAGNRELEAHRDARAAAHFLKATRLMPDGRYYLNLCVALDSLDMDAAEKACSAVAKLPVEDSVKARASERSARLRELIASSALPKSA